MTGGLLFAGRTLGRVIRLVQDFRSDVSFEREAVHCLLSEEADWRQLVDGCKKPETYVSGFFRVSITVPI